MRGETFEKQVLLPHSFILNLGGVDLEKTTSKILKEILWTGFVATQKLRLLPIT